MVDECSQLPIPMFPFHLKFCYRKWMCILYHILLEGSVIKSWPIHCGRNVTAHFWLQICRNNIHLITGTNLQLIQHKTIHRIHYTGQKMFKMGFTSSEICFHCTQNTTDNYTVTHWKNVLLDHISMEEISASIKHKNTQFDLDTSY